MNGRLNIRFLLIVLVGTIVLATTWFFVHRFQTKRRLSDYLVQATRAEEAEKFDRAARLLRSYVLANPRDIDARVHYGELLEKLARTPRAKRDALSVYEQVLTEVPERDEVRSRAVELAVAIRLADVALDLLEKLPAHAKGSGRNLYLRGLCNDMLNRPEEAEKDYERSYETEPKAETFARRATALRAHRVNRAEDADKVIDRLAEKLPDGFETHLVCAGYLLLYPSVDQVKEKLTHLRTPEEHLKEARQRAPDRPDVLIASARLALNLAMKEARKTGTDAPAVAKRLEEARGYLNHGIDRHPTQADLYLTMAAVETYARQRDKAIEVLKTARSKVANIRTNEVNLALAEQYAEKLGEPGANKEELKAGMEDAFAALQKGGEHAANINLVRGQALVRQGIWYDAAGLLEQVRPLFATQQEKSVRIDLLLASCYGRLGDVDRQLLAYRRAVTADPLDDRPRHGLADTLAALGRTEEAIDEYRHVTQMDRSPTAAWLALARLMVYLNLSKAEKERNWEQVLQLIEVVKTQTAAKPPVEVPLLEAEVRFAKGDVEQARKLLEASRAKEPKEPEYWSALATLHYRSGDPTAAGQVLDEAVKQLGDNVDFRIARLRITPFKTADATVEVLAKLAAGYERYSSEDQVRLLRTLAAAYWLVGQSRRGGMPVEDSPRLRAAQETARREAGRLWEEVARQRPTELQVRLFLFDVALSQNDESGMKRTLEEINRVEGGGPYAKYGEASRLIWRAEHERDLSGLADARGLLALVAARRGSWSRIPLSLARIDTLEGNTEDEIKHMKEAVDLGDRQIGLIQRLVALLNERERRVEADDILRRLQAQSPLSNDLQRLAAEESLQVLDTDRALTLAQAAVDPESKDYKERVWLAEMLSAGKNWAKADRHFEAAIELAGDTSDPLPWTSLVLHTLRQRDAARDGTTFRDAIAKLERALKRAEEKLGNHSPLALAACYDLAGKKDLAEAKYLAAAKTSPPDARALRAIAMFYQKQGSPEKGEPFLRQLLSPEVKAAVADIVWARRNLALAVGLRSERPDYDEAIRLLNLNEESVDDLRARAVVTATKSDRRKEVIALLERAEKKGGPPHPEAGFLLAKLYEAEGDWRKAKERMFQVIALRRDSTVYVAALVDSLIRRGDVVEAEAWVGKLTDTAPFRDQTVTLQVEVMCRLGQAADAIPTIQRYAEAKDATPFDPAARAVVVANLYDRVSASGGGSKARDAAEQFYLRHKELSKEPTAALALAGFYAKNNAPHKALTLCEEAFKTCPPLPVLQVAVTALSDNGERLSDQLEGWLAQAMAKEPENDNLRFLFAILREMQRRQADAEAEYRKILARSPKNLAAMNNLAFLLAMTGRGQEAVGVIADAPHLRETRAVAHLSSGNAAAARVEIEAYIITNATAVAYFHQAQVLEALKDKPRAAEALRKARLAGLRAGQLHPLERPAYDKLVAGLNP